MEKETKERIVSGLKKGVGKLMVLFTFAAAVWVLEACSTKTPEKEIPPTQGTEVQIEKTEPIKLAAPTVELSNAGVVTWSVISEAEEYIVIVNGQEVIVAGNSYTIPNLSNSALYNVSVKAIGDGTNYTNSDASSSRSIIYKAPLIKLASPTGLACEKGVTTWAAVENATGYVVTVNGKQYITTTNTFTFDTEEGIDYTIKVKATTNEKGYEKESTESTSIKYELVLPALEAPTNLSVSKTGLISWDAVENAVGYVLTVGSETYKVTENSKKLDLTEGLTYTISVKAEGDGAEYSESKNSATNISYEHALLALEAPANLSVSKTGLISWDAVENAVGYVLTVGSETYKVTENSKKLDLTEGLSYTISIKAEGDGVEYSESKNNATNLSYEHIIIREALATPILAVEDNKFVWSLVENAEGYGIKLNEKEFEGDVLTLPDGRKAVDILSLPMENQEITVVAEAEEGSVDYKDSEAATEKFDLEAYITKAYNEKTGSSAKLLAIKNNGFNDESLGYYDNVYEAGLTIVAFNELSIVFKHYVGETQKIGDIHTLLQNQEFNVSPADAELSTKSYGLHLLEFYTDKALDNDINRLATKILANPDNYDIVCYTDTKASPGHYSPMQFGRYFVREKETGEITMFTIAIYITRNDGYPSLTYLRLDRNKLYQNGLDYFFDENRASETHRVTEANSLKYFTMTEPVIIAGGSMFENEAEPSLSAETGVSLSEGGEVENETTAKSSTKKHYNVETLLKFAMSRLEAEQKARETAKHEVEPLTIEMPIDNNKSKSL